NNTNLLTLFARSLDGQGFEGFYRALAAAERAGHRGPAVAEAQSGTVYAQRNITGLHRRLRQPLQRGDGGQDDVFARIRKCGQTPLGANQQPVRLYDVLYGAGLGWRDLGGIHPESRLDDYQPG
nr:hypothetical protein [Tanacetum cinerariifolium]